jgi:hypothetical protein
MFKKLSKVAKSVSTKVSLIGGGLMATTVCAMADDPLAKALPTMQGAMAIGGTIYYTIFSLGLAGAIIKGKQTGDWAKWLGGWGICILAYSGAMLIIGGA